MLERAVGCIRLSRGCTHVSVMERSPPPAPARAWATLSACRAAVDVCAMVKGFDDKRQLYWCRARPYRKMEEEQLFVLRKNVLMFHGQPRSKPLVGNFFHQRLPSRSTIESNIVDMESEIITSASSFSSSTVPPTYSCRQNLRSESLPSLDLVWVFLPCVPKSF